MDGHDCGHGACDPTDEVNVSTQRAGPKVALRVAYAPVQESSGSFPGPFAVGDEIAVVSLDKIKGWEPLNWRQERSAKQSAAMESRGGRVPLPDMPRFHEAQRAWGAKVMAAAAGGGFEEHLCLLQVGASAKDRNIERVKAAVDDANDAASYAHRFNQFVANTCGDGNAEGVPHLKVCAPVGCYVLGSTVPDIVQAGEVLTLTLFPSPVVKKFLFEGSEEFEELPQAFFHYVVTNSGGSDMVCDLQGAKEEQNFYIVDPVMVRADKVSIGDLLGTLLPGGRSAPRMNTSPEMRFDQWHPKCGQLCRTFDPQRRSIHARKHCGLSLPSCGVGVGGA